MLLLIDNYDSFTFNLARYFEELGQEVQVIRNDQIDCAGIAAMTPDYLVFSPGPCTPNEAGITLEAIKRFAGTLPILGVCLGYQAIGQAFGADVCRAALIRHGMTSPVIHNNSALFQQVPTPFTATRYHSLVLAHNSIPEDFTVTAWCEEHDVHEIMAIEHCHWPLMGVQFHPESLLTDTGHQILSNFLRIGRMWQNLKN